MDHSSWLWKQKSSEKILVENESSGSASSHSGRSCDDQEEVRASPDNASSNHVQSPKVLSNISDTNDYERLKSLTEKLSAALLDVSAKEDLVKQHAKVAEEAVTGWEKAETEVTDLKQQLEAAVQKISSLEYRISDLDGALEECVQQLRQSREEQEQKVYDALLKKACEWESDKSELENRLVELQAQLQDSKSKVFTSADHGLQSKLETLEKETSALRMELLARSMDLEMRTLERDLSIQSAETASKQNLESIKKVAKLEAECRRLQAVARKTSSSSENGYKPLANAACMEALTDNEQLPCVDHEPCCSDSWASALIAELDQFKNEKSNTRNLASSVEINLMDDFLEMERLVALPENDHGISSFKLGTYYEPAVVRDNTSRIELKAGQQQIDELEEKIERMKTEKEELEMALADSRSQLEYTCNQLTVTEGKLYDLQKQIELSNESKQAAEKELTAMESKWKESESQLKSAKLDIEKMHKVTGLLERKLEEERALSEEFAAEVKSFGATKMAFESQLESASLDIRNLDEKLGLLEGKLEEERAASAGLEVKVEDLEATRKALESQLESAHLDAWELRDKVGTLERKLEEEMALSSGVSVKVEAVEAKSQELELQLESANVEVGKLRDRIGFLEGKLEEERASSAAFAAKCQNLENELTWKKRGAELQRIASSNGELKMKQEKELAMASDKLTECQKTIASLGRQLKSLANLDEFVLEAMKPEVNGGFPGSIGDGGKEQDSNYSCRNLSFSTHPNGRGRGSSPTSSSSLSGFSKLLTRSRTSRIERQ